MTCDQCGAELTIGEWPFCPHGRSSLSVVPDDIPGGQLIENLGPEPIRVYSESQRRRIMKERGLVDAVRHRAGSRLTSNWNVPSAQTLANAADLVSAERRQRPLTEHPDAQVETLEMTITERGAFRVVPDGEAYQP